MLPFWREYNFLTGLPISSVISPTPAGSSLLGLLWYRSASFTWTSCSSKASFWRRSFCVWPAWTPRSFSRARITLSLPFISSIWKEKKKQEGSFYNPQVFTAFTTKLQKQSSVSLRFIPAAKLGLLKGRYLFSEVFFPSLKRVSAFTWSWVCWVQSQFK